jgi:hypothetical protein
MLVHTYNHEFLWWSLVVVLFSIIIASCDTHQLLLSRFNNFLPPLSSSFKHSSLLRFFFAFPEFVYARCNLSGHLYFITHVLSSLLIFSFHLFIFCSLHKTLVVAWYNWLLFVRGLGALAFHASSSIVMVYISQSTFTSWFFFLNL